MAAAPLSRLRNLGALPVALLLVALFVALSLMSDAVQNSEELSGAFVPLLSLVLLGLLLLTLLVLVYVVRLVTRYRRQAAGSRLTGRLVLLFALISLLPVAVVYYFSLSFLLRGIDSWFDVEIDRAMQDALTLNQASLDLNQRVLTRYTELLLVGIQDQSSTALALSLGSMRRQAGALELTLFGPLGQVFGTANEDPTQLVPDLPEREVLQNVRTGINYVGLEPRIDEDLIIRVVVGDQGGRAMYLQAIYPTSVRISELSARLEDAFNRYRELSYLRKSLKLSFSLTLSLVLLFGLLAALIAAFHTARRLVSPVADIARGTRAVADGDYEQRLPLPKHNDELRFLVTSFNTMTKRIAQARDIAHRSQLETETQRTYLETVLGRLSSGVIAFDTQQQLRTTNPAARQILRLDGPDRIDPDLSKLEIRHPRLAPWVETVRAHIAKEHEWRTEISLIGNDGRQVLMCRGSPLPDSESDGGGHVVVFDDITTLITAQRDAAWGEVARRLAHEIKNPLTPIQLSAERVRHKLLAKLPEQDARIVDRATNTIVQQVEAMKVMVNDFSDYARSPQMQARPFVVDQLLQEVLELYRSDTRLELQAALQAPDARIKGDPKRLRQVIHNLLKNALEAMEGQESKVLWVTTKIVQEDEIPLLEWCVQDSGPGFNEDLRGRLFEPYVTSKSKGTGLGLAIVKKIIEEHGGMISADNAEHGARITARLPIWQGANGDTIAEPAHESLPDRHDRANERIGQNEQTHKRERRT